MVGHLKSKENEFLEKMTRNLVAPRNIISTLKDRDPGNKTSAKQICNACHRTRFSIQPFFTSLLCETLQAFQPFFSTTSPLLRDLLFFSAAQRFSLSLSVPNQPLLSWILRQPIKGVDFKIKMLKPSSTTTS
ncbi:unnamed protein product [Trifolium pratense]|uniref:Uncharacterized protein n=1 Tax=Trifolium pratense TaxID=57577 RepID=A0ACB0LUX9_TRIPR|nr:unnamed protein product [Trifolium pratense]